MSVLLELERVGKRFGARVAVDNTTATPLGLRPLELGADLVVASASKALTGHSDLISASPWCRPLRRSGSAKS